MLQRCENPKDKSFSNYGGRGITVCEEWHSSKNFIEWALNNGYSDELSIDRIDNDKGYSPNNCRWATDKVQANNKRVCHYIKAFGRTLTTAQWAELVGMDRKTIKLRIASGMSPEEALTAPLMKNGHIYKYLKKIKQEGGKMHRDEKLDKLINRRVTITFKDGSCYTGNLVWEEDRYKLKGVINEKTGFMTYDTGFRKSHIKSIKEKR